jgi:ABC-2 type transport system permease protein
MIRKDLLLFFRDRRALTMSFVVPITIASFFGSILSAPLYGDEAAHIPVALVDRDATAISAAIVARAQTDQTLKITTPTADEAREAVRRGTVTVAVVIPAGFGEAAGQAFFTGRDKPELAMWYDPVHTVELRLVRGIMTEHVMHTVSQQMFIGAAGQQVMDRTLHRLDQSHMSPYEKALLRELLQSARNFFNRNAGAASLFGTHAPGGFSVPYIVNAHSVAALANAADIAYAHAFAGFGIQFLLFAAVDLASGILLERQRGLWKRLRSAPCRRARGGDTGTRDGHHMVLRSGNADRL